MPYHVYVLQSESTGKTYVGQTSDLVRRLCQHNDPNFTVTLYTKRNSGPWKLLHSEEYSTRAEAMHREKNLKSGQGREWIKNNILKAESRGC